MSEHEEYDYARLEAENRRLRAALEKIMQCDDDGYGPDGYCANIAKAALEK